MSALPQDDKGQTIQIAPAKKAERVTEYGVSDIATQAQDLQLLRSSDFLEIHAVSGRVAVKYGTGATAIGGYDELITSSTPRQYSLRDELIGINHISVIAKDEGAEVIVIEK